MELRKIKKIDEMIESIWFIWSMESIFYAAAHSSLSLPPNHSLRMDGLVEKREEKKSLAAQGNASTKKTWNLLNVLFGDVLPAAGRAGGWIGLSFGWVKGAAAPRQPAKREDKPNRSNSLFLQQHHQLLLSWLWLEKPKKEWSWAVGVCEREAAVCLWLVCWLWAQRAIGN